MGDQMDYQWTPVANNTSPGEYKWTPVPKNSFTKRKFDAYQADITPPVRAPRFHEDLHDMGHRIFSTYTGSVPNLAPGPSAPPKEPHTAPPPPVQRFFINAAKGAYRAIRASLGWTDTKLKRGTDHAVDHSTVKDGTPATTQGNTVVEFGRAKKRKVSRMPGTFSSTPSPIKEISPPKASPSTMTDLITVETCGSSTASIKSAETNATLEKPTLAKPLSLSRQGLRKASVSIPTEPLRAPAPTPPSSSSSSSSEMQPLRLEDKPKPENAQPLRPMPLQPRPQPERNAQEVGLNRSGYRQPSLLMSYEFGPQKSILKKTKAMENADRDANVDNLITRAKKSVTIQSPEDQFVFNNYRKRMNADNRESYKSYWAQRDAFEEQDEREAEARRQDEIRFGETKKSLRKSFEAKKTAGLEAEIARLQLEQDDRERVRKEKDAENKAELQEIADAMRSRREEEKVIEAEVRRIADEKRPAAIVEEKAPGDNDPEMLALREIIPKLSAKWEKKVYQALANKDPKVTIALSPEGNELSRRDFGTLLPQQGTSDNPSGWLNDDIVNGYIAAIVAANKAKLDYKKGRDVPSHESYSSQWYKTYLQSGMKGIARWSKRKGIQGTKLLECQRIYFPVNTGNHWTLLIISPIVGQIEYLDSLNKRGDQKRFFAIAREWLATELGDRYEPDGWTDVYDSISKEQTNCNDCGVFTCLNALANGKNLPYYLVEPLHMIDGRKLIAATLINGGLNDQMKVE